jgi:hypothetical protein
VEPFSPVQRPFQKPIKFPEILQDFGREEVDRLHMDGVAIFKKWGTSRKFFLTKEVRSIY